MSTVPFVGGWKSRGVHQAAWSAMGTGVSGIASSAAELPFKSVQLTGTLGAGGAVVIEGSFDNGTTYGTLHDDRGNLLSLTGLGIVKINENAGLIRPRVTAGDGTTSLNVYIQSQVYAF